MTGIETLPAIQERSETMEAAAVIAWAVGHFGTENLLFASSLQIEDQVVLDLAVKADHSIGVVTLDTGRLPQETYDLIEATERRYGIRIEIVFPEKSEVEEMVNTRGPNLFYRSLEDRKYCCRVRKVEPLRRRLERKRAWITGLRREQAVTRSGLKKVEWDDQFGLVKINPLADWTLERVWEHVKKNNVPYHALYDRGYTSIGCAPCPRAATDPADVRSGRWWWESPEKKECGLHGSRREEGEKHESA